MTTTREKLARLHNRATLHEVIASNGDRRILVCYLETLSKRGLFEAIRRRGERIVASLGLPDDATLTLGGSAKCPRAQIGEWSIRRSGRTQREAIIEGELDYLPQPKGASDAILH